MIVRLLFLLLLLPFSALADQQTLLSFQDESVRVEANLSAMKDALVFVLESDQLKRVGIVEHREKGLLQLRSDETLFSGNMSLQCPDNPLLDRIRLQTNDSESLIELYFHGKELPSYSWQQEGKSFSLHTGARLHTSNQQLSGAPKILSVRRRQNSAIEEPKIKKSLGAEQLLKAILFQEDSKGKAMVKLAFSKQPAYQFSRNTEKSYLLYVPKADLESTSVGLPHFPPGDFPGITHIIAREFKGGLQIFFGIEEDHKIMPITREQDILLQLELRG